MVGVRRAKVFGARSRRTDAVRTLLMKRVHRGVTIARVDGDIGWCAGSHLSGGGDMRVAWATR